jgi:hypothetical protein
LDLAKDTCGLKDRLFGNVKTKGRFIDLFLRDSTSAVVDCAIDPSSGKLTYDPTGTADRPGYMDLVRDAVAAPMSTKMDEPPAYNAAKVRSHHATPVAKGAFSSPSGVGDKGCWWAFSSSTDAGDVGCKFEWWDKMFCRSAKNIPACAYSELLNPVSPGELWDCLRSTDGGKSPGHDSVGIDLLKVICRWDDGEDAPPCLLALLTIVNASLRLGYTPKPLREGWITMLPKQGKISNVVTDMRPITVLSEIGKVTS